MKKYNLLKYIDKFKEKTIAVIGDVMVDKYVYGKVDRISPEAPIPVVHVEKEVYLPGGAANVANNIKSLGANVYLFGVIGKDRVGEDLVNDLTKREISPNFIFIDPKRPTILKSRIVAHNQQVVRVDYENRDSISKDIEEKIFLSLEKNLNNINSIIISDYGKGIINKSILKKILNIANKKKLIVTVDPKIEHFKLYKNITAITPNLQEAVGGMHFLPPKNEQDIQKLGFSILNTLKCKCVIITRGEKGMNLFEKNGKMYHVPAKAKEVYDVTGAGDTVISVFTLSIACGCKFIEAAEIANYAACVVVGKLGTATVSPEELKNAILRSDER